MIPVPTIFSVLLVTVATVTSSDEYVNAPAELEDGSMMVRVPPCEKDASAIAKLVIVGGVNRVNVNVVEPDVYRPAAACVAVIVAMPGPTNCKIFVLIMAATAALLVV